MNSAGRYQFLDFWRGVACLLVVIGHSAATAADENPVVRSGASPFASVADWLLHISTAFPIGVPIFFVISGYCISASAVKHRDGDHSASRYFLRRFRRIFPPLWIYLLLVVSLFLVLDAFWPERYGRSPWQCSPWSWFGSFTLTESWRFHVVGSDSRQYLMGQLWTLCYEEQFYLVVGLILFACPRYLFATLALVTVLVRISSFVVPQSASNGFFFDGTWLAFSAGIAVYFALHRAAPVLRWAFTAGLLALASFQSNPTAFLFAAGLIVLFPLDERMSRSRLARPISACGIMCYSLYLAHMPVTAIVSEGLWDAGVQSPIATWLLTIPACIAASLAAAIPFHRFVELRYMKPPASPTCASDVVGTQTALDSTPVEAEIESPVDGTRQQWAPVDAQ